MIVVSYNTREKLRRCLSCIEPEHEIVVVDNGSADGSAAMVRAEFPAVMLIEAGENLGFGRANNRGAAVASRELLLFLNSDCYAEPGAILVLAGSFRFAEVSGAGGRLLNLDGSLQDSTANRMTLRAVLWEQTFLEKMVPIYWTTRKLDGSPEQLQYEDFLHQAVHEEDEDALAEAQSYATILPTHQVMGACLMCRRADFPGFDERFFLYMEDTMLCDALNRIGLVVWNYAATFTHELGASSSSEWWRGVARYNAGKELYFRITQDERSARICRALNKLGALLRVVVKPRRAAGFWRVFRA